MWTQAPELPWFDFSRSKLHNYSYFPQPADTSFQLSGPSFQSPCLHNPVPSSFYQKSCICHFLSHLAFYVTSNQYIKTLLQLLLPYSNFLHFCKSGSVLSPPSCYPVFCATLFHTCSTPSCKLSTSTVSMQLYGGLRSTTASHWAGAAVQNQDLSGQVQLATSNNQISHFPSCSIIPHSKQLASESCWLHRGQARLKGWHTFTTGRNLSCRTMTSKRADAQSLCPLPCNRSHFPENNLFPVHIPAGEVLNNKYFWNKELLKTFFILAILNWMFTRNTKYTPIMQWHFYMVENLSSSLVFPSLGLITLIPNMMSNIRQHFSDFSLIFLFPSGLKLIHTFSTISYQSWTEQNKHFSCLT